MERCNRCKKTIQEYSKYSNSLNTKDGVLSSFGDAMMLCTKCGETLAEVIEVWLIAGTPSEWRCGCMGRLYTQSSYRRRMADSTTSGDISYYSKAIGELQEKISRCKHPQHAVYWAAPDRKRVI